MLYEEKSGRKWVVELLVAFYSHRQKALCLGAANQLSCNDSCPPSLLTITS